MLPASSASAGLLSITIECVQRRFLLLEFRHMFPVPDWEHIALAAGIFALFDADGLKKGFPEANIWVEAVF